MNRERYTILVFFTFGYTKKSEAAAFGADEVTFHC